MSQVTEQSVRFQTALDSITLIQASAVFDLTEDDFDFLTSNKVWIATDRSRARRCVEACVYGTLDFVGYPRFPFFFSSRRRHTRLTCDWSSDVCSSDLSVCFPLWSERKSFDARLPLTRIRIAADSRDRESCDLQHDGKACVSQRRIQHSSQRRSEERRVGKEWRARWPPAH